MAYNISNALMYINNMDPPLKYFQLNHSCFVIDDRSQVLLNLADCGFTFNSVHFPMAKYPEYIAPEGMSILIKIG